MDDARIRTGFIGGGVGNTIQVLAPGAPINSFYVWEQVYDADGKPIEGEYVDVDSNGVINQNDLQIWGSPNPDWITGHTSYMSYGRFELNFTLRAQLGAQVYNTTAMATGTCGMATGPTPGNAHRSVLTTGLQVGQPYSSYYVEDADFLRMDNITLAYNFTYRGLPWRVFGTVQNVFTLTGYSGVDPTPGCGMRGPVSP